MAAINGEPVALSAKTGALGVPGVDNLEELVNAGLVNVSSDGALRPRLAEAVPSLENGLWQVFPDGRMETTWRIRPGVRWHDGVPFTTTDLVFTGAVVQDKDLPSFSDVAYGSIDEIEASDPQTVTIKWRRPYIDADTMFTRARAMPLPQHLLEPTYLEEKAKQPSFRTGAPSSWEPVHSS